MGICGRLLSLYRREEPVVDKRGKAILANGELHIIKFSPHLRVRDVCIEIAKKLDIAPVALDFFTLMTTDCEHCLRPNRQVQQQCDKQNDHYLNPKRVLHAEEIASKVFFFRLAFKAVAGPDLKAVNSEAYEYFVMQCRWDYINGRINNLSRKDHLTLLVLESIMQAHEAHISCKEVLDHPKRFGIHHLFEDKEYSCREIKSHLKKQLSQFKTAQNNIQKAKNSFLYVLEGVTDFGVTKIVVKKFYYQNASVDVVYPVEWEIMISPNGLKKRRTYKDERDDDNDYTSGNNRVDEMISDYKDIEYLEIKQSESDEIIHISRQKGFLEVISVGKSMIKKESLITLIEGFYHLFVNQYKTLTKYEPGLELPLSSARRNRKVPIHGPIERKKVEVLLKEVETENGDRSGVHMVRRSRRDFDNYNLSLIHGSEFKHYEIVHEDDKYGFKNGPKFDSMAQLLEFYKTEQRNFPTVLTKYCPIPKEGLCALYDDQIVVEAPCVPSTSRPANPDYAFEYIGNQQLEKLHHTFTCSESGDKIFKARWLKGDKGGCQEVFCRRIEASRAPNFRDKVVEIGENMAGLVHRNLVMFHGVQFNEDQNTYLAFEWLNSGTLDEYLKTETEITVETILSFAAQIAEACYYLHEQNYVHGWLAAHNVLIVNEEQIKLSDVSVPCLREKDMLCETVNINRSPWKARECFQGRRYSKESDVWAFGIVLWEMFMKTVPFQNMEDDKILRIFQQDHHLAYPKWCPDEVGKIMKSCWITEPTQRPTFAQIVVKLRQIMGKLTAKERARKIPETTDEKFTIEPLNIRKDKLSSLAPVDENLPRTSSCGSHDSSDGAGNESENNEGSEAADDFELDFIPEKESPEMLWSPKEIEEKRLERKYPRSVVTLEPTKEEVTYDRIGLNDSSVEPSEETCLLPSEKDEEESRSVPAVEKNEVPTAVDEPIEDDSKATNKSPEPTETLPKDLTEDDPDDDDEERPLLAKTTPAHADSIFASMKSMDHMGFLASQLGSEDNGGMLTDKISLNVDEETTPMDNGCAVDVDCGISEQEPPNVPNAVSDFFSGNLDPFAPGNRASEIFSKLSSPSGISYVDSSGKGGVPEECKYVSKTRFEMDPGPNSLYNPGKSPASCSLSRSTNIPSYMPASSGVHMRTDNGCSPTNERPSSSRIVEFSKLDPFAAPASGTILTNVASGLPQQGMSHDKRPAGDPGHLGASHNTEQHGGLLSSFSERDPMSEMSMNNDPSQPSSIPGQTSRNLARNKQSFSPNVNASDGKYVSPYSLGLVSRTNTKTSSFYPDRSSPTFTSNVTHGGQTSKKRATHSGYVAMSSNVPRPTLSRESAGQKPYSSGTVTLGTTFSQIDPFSENVGKVEEKTSGVTRSPSSSRNLEPRGFTSSAVDPASFRPTGITGATFENLFSKSRQIRSTGFTAPVIRPQEIGSPGIKSTSLAPSSSPSVAHIAGKHQTSSHVFAPPSFEKPSLGNLALKLSRQSVGRPGFAIQQPTSKPTSPSHVQEQNRNKNTEYGRNIPSSTSKKSGYVAVSNAENTKGFRKHASETQSSTSRKLVEDSPSLSDQDIFSSILQGSTSNTPFVNKNTSAGAVTMYTQAERDVDPYQKMPTRHNNLERMVNDVESYGEGKPGQTRANFGISGTSSTENVGIGASRQLPSPPPKQACSNYESLPHSVSAGPSAGLRPTVSPSPLGEEPRAETPASSQEVSLLETADILQLSQASFEDLLSGITLQNGQARESGGIELNEIPTQDIKETASFTENAEKNEPRAELKSDDTVVDVRDNVESEGLGVGFGFDSRDPFAEISLSQTELRECDLVNNPGNDGVKPLQDFAVNQLLNSRNAEAVSSSYSIMPTSNASEESNPTLSPEPQKYNSSDGPPGGSNNEGNPQPPSRKPNANRKASDIGVEYAKVLIQPKEPGAVEGEEAEHESTELDVPVEPAPEVADDRTSIDPFNKTEAEESIQNLDPYARGKGGNNVAVKFEESMKSHQIAFEYLTLDRVLGQGAFGVVRKAKLLRPGQGHKTRPPMDVAVKCCIDNASEIYKNSFKLEAINLMKLDNKFIVRFLGISYDDNKSLLLVTELVPQGSLDKYLKDQKNMKILGNEVLLQFAIQISMGMEYLESKKLVHRDLAARNILVATESHVKISDFGLSRIYDDEYYRSHRENQRLPIRWLAPECLEQKKFTHHSDIWSLGVTLWEMFSYGERPYDNWKIEYTADLIKELKAGKRLEKPKACLEDVYTHICDCWNWKPSSRISFFLLKMLLEQILEDKYERKPYFI